MVKTLTTMSLVPVTAEGPIEDKLRKLRYVVDVAVNAHWLDGDKVSAKQMDKFAVILRKLDQTSGGDGELSEGARTELDALLVKEAGALGGEREGIAHSRPKRTAAGNEKRSLKEDDEDDEDESDSE